MCYGCYQEAGEPKIINDKVKLAAEAVTELYDHPDGCVGGYAHIVTDDWNLEDRHIDFCIDAVKKGDYSYDKKTAELSLKALDHLKGLSEKERQSALALSNGWI